MIQRIESQQIIAEFVDDQPHHELSGSSDEDHDPSDRPPPTPPPSPPNLEAARKRARARASVAARARASAMQCIHVCAPDAPPGSQPPSAALAAASSEGAASRRTTDLSERSGGSGTRGRIGIRRSQPRRPSQQQIAFPRLETAESSSGCRDSVVSMVDEPSKRNSAGRCSVPRTQWLFKKLGVRCSLRPGLEGSSAPGKVKTRKEKAKAMKERGRRKAVQDDGFILRDKIENIEDKLELLETMVFSLLLTSSWQTCYDFLFPLYQKLRYSDSVNSLEDTSIPGLVLSIAYLTLMFTLLGKYDRNIRSMMAADEGNRRRLSQLPKHRIAARMRFIGKRFGEHAPFWQFVVWARQLLLFLVTIFPDFWIYRQSELLERDLEEISNSSSTNSSGTNIDRDR